jgi:single-strand DNA-binding protein
MRYLPNGTVVTNFTVYDHYKYSKGREDITRFRVVFFGKVAELANEFLSKGDLVVLSGRLRLVTFTGRDGKEKTFAEIIGNEFRSLTRRRQDDDDATEPDGESWAPTADVDDLPF